MTEYVDQWFHEWVKEAKAEYGTVNKKHDKGYKYLLSFKRIFIQLVKSFVNEGWVSQIREDNVERIDKSFILNDFNEKEADVVYKVNLGDTEVIFYILLELQSKVDYQMPYRLLLYMVEIWRNILKDYDKNTASRKDFKLPVIVPCVLYNGEDNWTVSEHYRETLGEDALFGEYALDFRYFLFNVKRYDEKKLFEMENVISSVFYIDQERNYEGIFRRVNELLDHLKKMSSEDFNIFKTWLKNISVSGLGTENAGKIRKAIDKSEEAEGMVYSLGIAIKEEIDKAKQEGRRGGQIDSILELLGDLGDVPENLRNKIYAQQDITKLSSWHKIAARAENLEEFEKRISKLN